MVLIEPAPQTPLDRLDVIINQNEQSSHEEDDENTSPLEGETSYLSSLEEDHSSPLEGRTFQP